MPTYTSHYNLIKQLGTEHPSISQLNANFDAIDTQMYLESLLKGTSNPTTSTVGAVGQWYMNTTTGATFRCTVVAGSVYTWVPDNILYRGTCSTAAATAAKVVTCAGFVLTTGAMLVIAFDNVNTATSPTVNANSTGAIAVYCFGSAATASQMPKNPILQYDGTYYQLLNPIGAQIIAGSYTGTGAYGSGSPNTIATPGTVKFAIVQYSNTIAFMFPGASQFTAFNGSNNNMGSSGSVYTSWGNCTATSSALSWFNTASADSQMNSASTSYSYLLFI